MLPAESLLAGREQQQQQDKEGKRKSGPPTDPLPKSQGTVELALHINFIACRQKIITLHATLGYLLSRGTYQKNFFNGAVSSSSSALGKSRASKQVPKLTNIRFANVQQTSILYN